jgi:hypothetical protein
MRSTLGCALAFALVSATSLGQGPGQGPGPGRWRKFRSSTGFSVRYPANWFRKGVSKDRLLVLSSRGGAEGLIINRGQAFISVVEERKYEGLPLRALIDYFTARARVLSQRTVRNGDAGSRGCRVLQEVVSRAPIVPPEDVPGPVPYVIDTGYFCQIGRKRYVTSLRNFEGDKRQASYREIALRVAESLRIDK